MLNSVVNCMSNSMVDCIFSSMVGSMFRSMANKSCCMPSCMDSSMMRRMAMASMTVVRLCTVSSFSGVSKAAVWVVMSVDTVAVSSFDVPMTMTVTPTSPWAPM